MAETAHFAADCQSGFHTCNNNNKNGRVILSQTKGHKLSVGLSALRFGKRFSVRKCRKEEHFLKYCKKKIILLI